jgi:hypothetical protein
MSAKSMMYQAKGFPLKDYFTQLCFVIIKASCTVILVPLL